MRFLRFAPPVVWLYYKVFFENFQGLIFENDKNNFSVKYGICDIMGELVEWPSG